MIKRLINGFIEAVSREFAWFKIRTQYKQGTGRLVRPNKYKGAQI